MAAVLEDVSEAQNVEKHLHNHKGPKNLCVIFLLFFFSSRDWTRKSGPDSQNILNKLIFISFTWEVNYWSAQTGRK